MATGAALIGSTRTLQVLASLFQAKLTPINVACSRAEGLWVLPIPNAAFTAMTSARSISRHQNTRASAHRSYSAPYATALLAR